MQRSADQKYVRTSTGHRARSRSKHRGRAPANKGAHCVARQRVYSRVLRRHVMRCRKFEGGRVGIRKRPLRKPGGPHCSRFKHVYSSFFRKKVRRCAKYTHKRVVRVREHAYMPETVTFRDQAALFVPPAGSAGASQQSVVFAPAVAVHPIIIVDTPSSMHDPKLLPPYAKSLRNREQVYRRLQGQMRRMQQKSTEPRTSNRWPQDRPRTKKSRS